MKTKLHIYHKILLKFSNPNHVFEWRTPETI
jgi:hypothetical protein